MNRNMELERQSKVDLKSCIKLPFILVNTHAETKINCEMLEDRYLGSAFSSLFPLFTHFPRSF